MSHRLLYPKEEDHDSVYRQAKCHVLNINRAKLYSMLPIKMIRIFKKSRRIHTLCTIMHPNKKQEFHQRDKDYYFTKLLLSTITEMSMMNSFSAASWEALSLTLSRQSLIGNPFSFNRSDFQTCNFSHQILWQIFGWWCYWIA